jgi:SH3 domain protein
VIQLKPNRRAAAACLLAVAALATGSALAQEDPGVAMAPGEAEAWSRQLEELALANEELGRQNALLRDRVGDLRQQLDATERAGLEQRTREQRRWFITGAGVLLAGVLLGLVLARLRLRRRSRWGDL